MNDVCGSAQNAVGTKLAHGGVRKVINLGTFSTHSSKRIASLANVGGTTRCIYILAKAFRRFRTTCHIGWACIIWNETLLGDKVIYSSRTPSVAAEKASSLEVSLAEMKILNWTRCSTHLPAMRVPQLSTNWMLKLISSLLELVILMRSESAERAPCAQQLPQYWGICWFSEWVRYECPFTFPQLKLSGRSSSLMYVYGSAEWNFSRTWWSSMTKYSLCRLTALASVEAKAEARHVVRTAAKWMDRNNILTTRWYLRCWYWLMNLWKENAPPHFGAPWDDNYRISSVERRE